ncbi:hypothetical protein SUGI_0649970 [Cryptomeria japonica]|nr:hypothetical protein SUGI_0649970 [Cryptomeria japonica]
MREKYVDRIDGSQLIAVPTEQTWTVDSVDVYRRVYIVDKPAVDGAYARLDTSCAYGHPVFKAVCVRLDDFYAAWVLNYFMSFLRFSFHLSAVYESVGKRRREKPVLFNNWLEDQEGALGKVILYGC